MMAGLPTFMLSITQAHTEKMVQLGVMATDWDTANALAEGLAQLMPPSEAYFDKEDKMVTAYWSGMAEEINNSAEEQPWLGG